MNIVRHLIGDYIEDQWINFRRQLNSPKAREELLSCATLHTYYEGSTAPQETYNDADLTTLNAWPVTFDSFGRLPPVYFKDENATVTIRHMDGIQLCTCMSGAIREQDNKFL